MPNLGSTVRHSMGECGPLAEPPHPALPEPATPTPQEKHTSGSCWVQPAVPTAEASSAG